MLATPHFELELAFLLFALPLHRRHQVVVVIVVVGQTANANADAAGDADCGGGVVVDPVVFVGSETG